MMSTTPRTQLVRRFSTVGGRIVRGEKKAAPPDEAAFTSHLNAATTLHRRKLRQSPTQLGLGRQQDGADASSPAGTSNVLGIHAAVDIRKSRSMGGWSEVHRDSATGKNRKSEDQRYETTAGASAVAPKSATEVYRTERAKKQGEFFTAKTIDEENKTKSNSLRSGESATGEEFLSVQGLVPVLAIVSGSALFLYNLEALQGML